jgi:hypothetical protein
VHVQSPTLVSGPEDRQTPGFSAEFLKALAATHPRHQTYTIHQRNGATFAQLVEVVPNTTEEAPVTAEPGPSSISFGDPSSERLITGFYAIESGGWRWTRPKFNVQLGLPELAGGRPWLALYIFVPEALVRKLGPVTLSAR